MTRYHPGFDARLDHYRAEYDAKYAPGVLPPPFPTSLQDQIQAAGRDAYKTFEEVSRNPLFAQESGGSGINTGNRETYAYAMTALDGCVWCEHLIGSGPQPAFAMLAVGCVWCVGCLVANALTVPPEEMDDVCDWCLTHGHTEFNPTVIALGPITFHGDACDDCHQIMKAGAPQQEDNT